MRKVTSYKCPECGMSYKTLSGWGDHVRRLHPEIVPKGWSDARFFYYTLTGKSEGSCIQCHQPTEWNEATGKYSRYCNNPKCKQDYCKMAKQRMIDKYGKPHLLDDPDKQREMLKAKKNSGEYKFSTGGKVGYVCSYERDFLMTCDVVLGLKATDIISPSPHNYVYMYEGKPHIYIPDFYIPDFNLEIEIKDGGDNPNMHHKIQEVDKVKEKLKDQVMIANPSVNYFKVVNKKYDDFYDFILNCKNAIDDDKLKQVQSKITAIQQPAIEGISLFEARKDALKQAERFNIAFNIIAGPMLDREIELAFGKYRDYSNLSHSYSYPYYFYRGTPKFIDPAYKNTEDLILEIPLMVVNTHKPFRYRDDHEFDSNKIVDVLHTFERNLNNTIKLHNLYKKYPNVSAPYVQWEGSDWKLEVTMHYSMDPANESVEYNENDIANESAFINHKDEYFNIDQWKRSTGHNILYIAGLSGSGKSTLGRDISKKYNATYIELDRIASDWWYEDERFNPNGYQGNVTALLKEIFKDEDPREEFKTPIDRSVMRKRRYSKLYEYCLKHPDQLFIFEGVQVAGYFDIDFLVDKPVIVKNTSRNTSFKRMSIRDREIWTNRENYLDMKANYKADDHNLDSLRKLMRENASPSPALESVDKDTMFETPQELQSWMKTNISYAEFTKLMSPEEVMTKKRGSCHDQAMFAYSCLKKMGYKPKLLFFITYANGNPVGDMTHTLCYYEESDKIYWIENAWEGAKGIRAYPSVNALKNDVWQRYKKMPNFKKYPEIEFSDISPKIPGMKLDEYVSSALESAPALESGLIMAKTGNLDWIIEKRMTTQDFKNIPDNSVLHLTRDAYLERLAKNPSSMRDLEYYGFYNRKYQKLVGILSIASDGNTKYIDLLVVDDIYRRRGIGSHMLDSAVTNHGATWLVVKTSNGPAISIYEKYGFKIVDTYPGKTGMVHRMEYHSAAMEGLTADKMKSFVARTGIKLLALPDAVAKMRSKGKKIEYDQQTLTIARDNHNNAANFIKMIPSLVNDIKNACYPIIKKYNLPEKIISFNKIGVSNMYYQKDSIEIGNTPDGKVTHHYFFYVFNYAYSMVDPDDTTSEMYKRAETCKTELLRECDKVYRNYEKKYNRLSHHVDVIDKKEISVATYVLWKLDGEYVDKYESATESISSKPADYNEYERIFKSCSKHERAMYGYDIGIDEHTCFTKRMGDAYVLLDDHQEASGWHPYPGKYISIAAAPSVRGTGVTDKLITAAKNAASDDIIAIIMDDNVHSRNLFTRNGFKLVGNKKFNEDRYDYYIFKSSKSANESAGSDSTYYGLPEDKKYPMDDPKHVLLAIKFFNYVDEDKEELLASRINSRIAEFKIHNINVGEKNRFAKYYTPVEEEVVVDWAPNVPYMTVANEGADPSVQLLDDGFAYAPIKLDRDLYEKYKGTDYYPLYIILMKNISPLGSIIRAYTKEEYSHSAISFDASMDDVYTFGNSVIKKPLGKQKSFGAAHESFRKNSFKFSYSGKTEYSLYVMFFKKDEIDRIKKKVDEIFLHHDEYKYNVEGLISYIFNRPKTDPKKLFCSQFVALVINSGRNGILNKDPSLYSPVGLTTIRGICHVETGHIEDYDQYRVEKKTRAVFDSLIENHAYEALEHANIMYNA